MDSDTSFSSQEHEIDARIYYADTDFSGFVYHARYLEFFERGRTEFLRRLNIEQNSLAKGYGEGQEKLAEALLFVVRGIKVNYHKSALMDDKIFIRTKAQGISGAVMFMEQKIIRKDEENNDVLLTTAHVEIALINTKGRPRRFPKALQKKLFFIPSSL